jgi:aromatic ring-opening dioxygenase LigB subunit
MPRWISTLDANLGVSFCNITLRETKFYIGSQKAQSEARYSVDKRILSKVYERERQRAQCVCVTIRLVILDLGDPRYSI